LAPLALLHQALGFHQRTQGFGGQLARDRLRDAVGNSGQAKELIHTRVGRSIPERCRDVDGRDELGHDVE
jgi:hypothetical protein